MVHFAKLLAARIWWTGCRDDVIPPDELVILFPHHSINYGLKLINEIYDDSENDSMLYDIERTELIVRSTEISPPCLTPPLSRSSSTVRITPSEINDEEGEYIEAALSDNMEANNS